MIEARQIVKMVEHWLSTPPNGYFAQGYGSDLKALLLKNPSSEMADKFIAKLKQDIPLFANFDGDRLSIESEMVGFDTEKIYLFVADIPIFIGDTQDNNINQDYYDSRAS